MGMKKINLFGCEINILSLGKANVRKISILYDQEKLVLINRSNCFNKQK